MFLWKSNKDKLVGEEKKEFLINEKEKVELWAKAVQKKVEEAPVEEEKPKEEEKPPQPDPSPAEAKAALKPPQDPLGEQVLHRDLLFSEAQLREMLQGTRQKFLTCVFKKKSTNLAIVKREGKEMIDASVDELDESLRA